MKFIFALFLFAACAPVHALRPSNVTFFSAQANTAGAKNSIVVSAQNITSGSIQASFTDAAAAGTLLIQCSNDAPSTVVSGQNFVPVNWSTCANASNAASATVASGATTLISMQWLNSRWIRVQWTRSAGAGTLTVYGQFQAD